MGAYKHRVHVSELSTSILPPRRVDSAVAVVFGTAPVHTLEAGTGPVNTPVLCHNYADFATQFGFSDEKNADGTYRYTLCEFARSQFGIFGVGPVVFVNVFDPAAHQTDGAPDVGAVSTADIVGGIDADSGRRKGMELLGDVFPAFRLVPGLLLAPGFSHEPEVGLVLAEKAKNVNTLFKAMALTDGPQSLTRYTELPGWKEEHGYTGEQMVLCWPMAKLGDERFHLSTLLAGLIASTDEEYGSIPYVSPSNRHLPVEGAVAAGETVHLGLDQAEYLNGQGIVTLLNFDGGWKCFGNRTACYPSNTDPKDSFIPVRRFFNWHGNTFILTYFQKLDGPIVRRLIESIVDSENIRLNGMRQREIILGGEMRFLEAENPATDLIDGVVRFHSWITPPVPAREIENILEFDPSRFSALFGG